MVGQQTHDAANTTLESLAHHRRRYALHVLREHEEPMALADLADEVAVREHDEPLAEIDPETVKEVYISLYHVHVPKLADAEHVLYSQELDAVALADHADRMDGLLRYVEGNPTVTN